MSDEDAESVDTGEETLFEDPVGTKLRDARISQKLELDDIAKITRIPTRQLENIETSNYEGMPAPTYATGFVKTYAREVGLDQNAIGAQFREEISYRTANETAGDYFEPADPARVPPRKLAWIAAGIGIALVLAYAIWRGWLFGDSDEDRARLAANGVEQESSAAEESSTDAPADAADGDGDSAAASGPVMLTARGTVWLRIYELESDQRIYEAEMSEGDSYEVPADAENPAILTGRPDLLVVTVGGRPVAPLGTADRSISDVSLLPENLANRRNSGEDSE